jgi:tetratricopeptide (TPR) repeat protein/cellulose biosynthesis protein BcsQ
MENNNTNTTDRKGQTVTFYSYKGGVGRSMALVNIACLAAKEKKKVLLIDCDLEAPGLHQFFKTPDETPGFVDLVTDINSWVNEESNNDEEGYNTFMAKHINNYIAADVSPFAPNFSNLNVNIPNETLPKNTELDTSITIDLIKSGRFDTGYSKKLSAINWLELYKKAPAFFRTFASWLEKEYDYIFVDARTGLADTSGICTMLMPQKLVLVFVLNKQNINGVVDVAAQAIDYRFDSYDPRRLDIYPLPSRIENSVNPFLQHWIDNYKEKFVKLFKEKYRLDDCRLSPYFDRCFIQYYAIHAYGENIPVLTESTASSNFISYNYNNFFSILKKNLPAWEVISAEEELANEKQAGEYFRKGLDLYYKNEFDKAIEEYNNAINLKPDFTDAYFNRGLSYFALKKYSQAVNDYNVVIQVENNASDAYYNRGLAKNNMSLYEEAIKDYDKAIEIKPDYYSAYNNRGLAKESLKKQEEAITDYSKAIEIKPDYALAYMNRGISKEELKQLEDALKDYDKAIELKPDYDAAYNNRGLVKEYLKQFEEAIKDYDKAIEIKPDYALAYMNRGISKEALKQYDGAIKDYNKAIELKPAFDIYNLRGNVKYNSKQYMEAIEDYSKAIELNPNFAMGYRNRGLANYEYKKYAEAINDCSLAIQIMPEYMEAYIDRGYASIKIKKYKEAIDDFNKVLIAKPDDIATLNGLANVYRHLKEYDKAIEYNEKSLAKDNSDDGLFGTRAEIFAEKGDEEGFYLNIEKAISLGLDVNKEMEEEPEIMNRYLTQPRFQELTKKYNIQLSTVNAMLS